MPCVQLILFDKRRIQFVFAAYQAITLLHRAGALELERRRTVAIRTIDFQRPRTQITDRAVPIPDELRHPFQGIAAVAVQIALRVKMVVIPWAILVFHEFR